MKYPVKKFINELSPKDLLNLCNEKILCAARDLAEFTKYGLNANFIVSLAHKCEEYEKIINQPDNDRRDYSRLETELREALEKICKTGRQIWAQYPSKYNNYVIYSTLYSKARYYAA